MSVFSYFVFPHGIHVEGKAHFTTKTQRRTQKVTKKVETQALKIFVAFVFFFVFFVGASRLIILFWRAEHPC
jgi:hypothetical protein